MPTRNSNNIFVFNLRLEYWNIITNIKQWSLGERAIWLVVALGGVKEESDSFCFFPYSVFVGPRNLPAFVALHKVTDKVCLSPLNLPVVLSCIPPYSLEESVHLDSCLVFHTIGIYYPAYICLWENKVLVFC